MVWYSWPSMLFQIAATIRSVVLCNSLYLLIDVAHPCPGSEMCWHAGLSLLEGGQKNPGRLLRAFQAATTKFNGLVYSLMLRRVARRPAPPHCRKNYGS